jgi:NADH dehydrogenase
MARDKDGKELFGTLVTVLGGSGFFGRHLAQELLRRGARLRIASRSPARAFRLKPLAAIGQIELVRCDVTSAASLNGALAGADMVVNLVGAFGGNLDALQGRGARRIAQGAQDAGARAFVHVSAIGADPESPYAYARTKGDGEIAVRAGFPQATIMRPSILFAQDDAFTTMFGRLIALFPALPVFGPQAKLQPVFVDDAAQAIVSALVDPGAHGGKTFELAGPEVITMLELNRRIAAAQGRRRGFMPLPDVISGAIASATGWLPGAPLSRDQWGLLKQGNVASGALPGLADLGVTAHPLGLYLDRWMVPMRKHGRFGAKTAAR